ncbi:MAG: GAF domain-containing protein [Bacteroidales bacterium]|nr:GAF domain-containing protein [Bacteroidales bacterium]
MKLKNYLIGIIFLSNGLLFTFLLVAYFQNEKVSSYTFLLFFISFISFLSYFLIFRNRSKSSDSINSTEKVDSSVLEKKDTNSEKTDTQEPVIQIDYSTLKISFPNEKALKVYCNNLLISVSEQLELAKGIMYVRKKDSLKFLAEGTYAFYSLEPPVPFEENDGLNGQVARDKEVIYINKIPDKYLEVVSGLGNGSPKYLLILPLIHDNQCFAVLELASFKSMNFDFNLFINTISEKVYSQIEKYL